MSCLGSLNRQTKGKEKGQSDKTSLKNKLNNEEKASWLYPDSWNTSHWDTCLCSLCVTATVWCDHCRGYNGSLTLLCLCGENCTADQVVKFTDTPPNLMTLSYWKRNWINVKLNVSYVIWKLGWYCLFSFISEGNSGFLQNPIYRNKDTDKQQSQAEWHSYMSHSHFSYRNLVHDTVEVTTNKYSITKEEEGIAGPSA